MLSEPRTKASFVVCRSGARHTVSWLILSGLGVLRPDIAQSSSVWSSTNSLRKRLRTTFSPPAMRIGRDHIASTVYTIRSPMRAASPLMILTMLYNRPPAEALTRAEMSEGVVRTIVGSTGQVVAIPVTPLKAQS